MRLGSILLCALDHGVRVYRMASHSAFSAQVLGWGKAVQEEDLTMPGTWDAWNSWPPAPIPFLGGCLSHTAPPTCDMPPPTKEGSILGEAVF